MDPTPRGSVVTPRLIFGLFILAAGALLVADRLGLIDSRPIFHYWPLVLIAIGLTKLFQPRGPRGGAWVLLFLGVFFLAREMDWTDLDFTDLFPFALVAVGLVLVITSLARRGDRFRHGDWRPAVAGAAGPDGSIGPDGAAGPVGTVEPGAPGALGEPSVPARPARPAAEEVVDAFAMLGSVRHGTSSQSFRGGTATAVAGSCEIDLRQAAIAGGEAVIDTFAFWGGVDILVPETWSVSLRGTPLLGSFENRARPPVGGSTQVLVIKGLALMGGVQVMNDRERR